MLLRRTRKVAHALPVNPEDVEAVRIARAMKLSETIERLGLHGEVKPLSIPGSDPFIPPRLLHHQDPLSILHAFTGVELRVEFYEVEGTPIYFLREPPFTEEAKRVYAYLWGRLTEIGARGTAGFIESVKWAFQDTGIDPHRAIADPDVVAGIYYVWRDLVGLGPVEPFMLDVNVEEISWFNYHGSLQVVDKKLSDYYPNAEFVETNMFVPEGETYEMRRVMLNVTNHLVKRAGTALTVARPIAEGRIFDTSARVFHRLAAHTDNVSDSPGFTIRKFPSVKYAITRLIAWGTLNPLLAAYLIYIVLNRGFVLIVGSMGSGKTTLLQALIAAIPSTLKVLSIEDTPELALPTWNHHKLYTRRVFGRTEVEDIDQDRLTRHALRHRAFIIAIGEVRGREMATLIQAAASGHGAMCTFHAEDPLKVLMRITAPPINVAPESLTLIHSVVHIERTKTYARGRPENVRRVLETFEVDGVKGRDIQYHYVFKWNPVTDKFNIEDGVEALASLWHSSRVLRNFAKAKYGEEEATRGLAEIAVIAGALHAMAKKGVFAVRDVNERLNKLFLVMDEKVEDVWRTVVRPAVG